jgi:hypothetical protein
MNLILAFTILCLFLYTKIKPVKNNLTPNLKKIYELIELFFDKVLFFMGKYIKPISIGTNLSIDISQIVLLIALLILILL